MRLCQLHRLRKRLRVQNFGLAGPVVRRSFDRRFDLLRRCAAEDQQERTCAQISGPSASNGIFLS